MDRLAPCYPIASGHRLFLRALGTVCPSPPEALSTINKTETVLDQRRQDLKDRNETCVGIDVARDRLDVQVGRDGPLARAWRFCVRVWPRFSRPGLSWKPPVAQALSAVGYAVARVNPCYVRDFGRALSHWAKTDAIDAALLARFAETQALRGLVGCRR